jgi:hypothetical protein
MQSSNDSELCAKTPVVYTTVYELIILLFVNFIHRQRRKQNANEKYRIADMTSFSGHERRMYTAVYI